ncbi:MAG: ABC transporter substrate-binding protein [Sandaracinaceae bacterium]|nr:ABC transporter substrate-binding protein [Sandaracinaceae bacterium]
MTRRTFVAIAAAGLACACGPERTLPPDAFAPIRIGVVVSRTGGLGGAGPGWEDASRLAALEVNAAGGLLGGRPVELVSVDDETNTGDPDFHASLANGLMNQGVVGVVGAAASSISLGLAAVLTPMRIPQLSCCSTSDRITAFNEALEPDARYFFRTIPPDSLQSEVVAVAAGALGCMNVAILHLDDDYGQPFGEAIEAALRTDMIPVAIRAPFREGLPSYSSLVSMVIAASPDCVSLVAFPGSAGAIFRDWNSAGGPAVTWIGTDGIREPAFVDEVGDASIIRNVFGTSPITDAPTPEYNAYSERFRASLSGAAPIPFSSNQYDATALLMLAIERAGTTDGPAVRDALHEVSNRMSEPGFERAGALTSALNQLHRGRDIDYQGASGNCDFDALGNVVTPYEIWRYDRPGSTDDCPGPRSDAGGGRGSFCRFRTIAAEDIRR